MDMLLGKVTQQAMNYAIRSGVTLTATYAIRQSTKLLQASPKSNVKDKVFELQQKLQHKIRIISPAIDMIELIAARGNTSLESAVTLTRELRLQIQSLGQRIAKAAATTERQKAHSSKLSAANQQENELELLIIADDIKNLLEHIEDAVPLINLAITTSGATLSTKLPASVSPSRLLQASTLLTAGDTQYNMFPRRAVQIGPTFTLSVYMLFAGHNRPQNEEDIRETTWKEVIHKARVKLRRVPLDVVVETGSGSDAIPSAEITAHGTHSEAEKDSRIPAEARGEEFAYQVMIVEDFNDDRVHDFGDEQQQPGPFDDVRLAGIREMIPIHELSKIFYADTSKVLNIAPESETNHPVLLLKRDVNAVPPRRMVERDGLIPDPEADDDYQDAQQSPSEEQYVEEDRKERNEDPWRLPKSLDPEWIAFEVYNEEPSSDTESEGDGDVSTSNLESNMANLNLSPQSKTLTHSTSQSSNLETLPPPAWTNHIVTSLSLLELLLRLTSLQQFQQASHLSITDELLNFFLEESASTGAGGDEEHRQAVRADARRRVGWDPYDESPLKRRGEDYQNQPASSQYGGSPYGAGSTAGGYNSYPREGTPMSPHQPPPKSFYSAATEAGPDQTGSPSAYNAGWSPQPSPARGVQSKSETSFSDSGFSPASPGTGAKGSRTDFIKRYGQPGQGQGDKAGSPLRQERSRISDEGIGTSPASEGAAK